MIVREHNLDPKSRFQIIFSEQSLNCQSVFWKLYILCTLNQQFINKLITPDLIQRWSEVMVQSYPIHDLSQEGG